MLEDAKAIGHWNEKKMWSNVEDIDAVLCALKKHDEDLYWEFMRETYGLLHENHYADEDWAMWDVSCLSWVDKEGKKHEGAHWSMEQVEEATKSMQFHPAVTKYDKYVAFNAAYADWNKTFDDSQILHIAYDFYFDDDDFKGDDKIWEYMKMTHSHKV
jgi:hypothetical protein